MRKDSLPGAFLCPLLTDSHSPHACPTPGVYTFTVTQSIGCFTSLALGFSNRPDQNSQSSVAGVGLSLGENHFPTNSLTWRELPTGLTTCLFNHNHLPHLERVLHTGLTTCFFNLFPHKEDNNKAQQGTNDETSHTQPRDCMATTTNNYDTHDTDKYGMLGLHRRHRSVCSSPWVHRTHRSVFPPSREWFLG
jgi:hypothetical protein